MNILLTSIGTRGDMEPFLALGEILREKGHRIVCLFPEQFRPLVEDAGFEFASLGKEFLELLNTPAGKIAMGGGPFGFKKLNAYIRLISDQSTINKLLIQRQHKTIHTLNPDRIVHNGKVIYPVVWSLNHPGKTTLISPVPYLHYVKDHSHVAFNTNLGPFINKLTYKIANYGLVKTIMSSLKWLDESRNISQKRIQQALFSNNTIYTISPALFERPHYWNDNIQVLGYHERTKTRNWSPSPELEHFLQQHPKIVFVTFGSMVNNAPDEKTRILLEVLERNNIPAIINTAAGGLVKPSNYRKDLFFFLERIPYEWIFPKMYAVIHHGGSGTTHTALKYGCANLILPHIIDQYIWNKIAHKKGTGPLGIDISRITPQKLEPKIVELMTNPSFKKKAQDLGEKMRAEDFKNAVYQSILAS